MSKLNVAERILKAAKSGDLFAQYELGMRLDYGYDGTQDFSRASGWYAKAAKQGHQAAKSNLLLKHVLGQASQYPPTEVIAELRRLAMSGDASAQNNLGLCYQFGYGTFRCFGMAGLLSSGTSLHSSNWGTCTRKVSAPKRIRGAPSFYTWLHTARVQSVQRTILLRCSGGGSVLGAILRSRILYTSKRSEIQTHRT